MQKMKASLTILVIAILLDAGCLTSASYKALPKEYKEVFATRERGAEKTEKRTIYLGEELVYERRREYIRDGIQYGKLLTKHKVYWNGKVIFELIDYKLIKNFGIGMHYHDTVGANVHTQMTLDGKLTGISIARDDLTILRSFYVAGDDWVPSPTSAVNKANALIGDLKTTVGNFKSNKTDKAEFCKELGDIQEKYKNE